MSLEGISYIARRRVGNLLGNPTTEMQVTTCHQKHNPTETTLKHRTEMQPSTAVSNSAFKYSNQQRKTGQTSRKLATKGLEKLWEDSQKNATPKTADHTTEKDQPKAGNESEMRRCRWGRIGRSREAVVLLKHATLFVCDVDLVDRFGLVGKWRDADFAV